MAGKYERVYNNFITGEVTPKLAGRDDKTVYFTGVRTFENALPLLQGGFTVRPNTLRVDTTDVIRLIPFVIDNDTSFQIGLGNKFMEIRKDGELQTVLQDGVEATCFDSPYTTSEINELQFAQDWESLILVHRNHPPKQIVYSLGSFIISDFVPTFQTDENYPDTDNTDFCTGTNCPGVVTYFMQRLWFFSSYDHPYGIWASRPFYSNNFEMYDVTETTDDVATAEAFEEAIKNGDDEVDVESVTIYEKTYRADNAMYLEVGSNRNDAIKWATASSSNLLIGTSNSEYAIPSTVTALSPYISTISFYGSEMLEALSCNTDVLFLGKGSRKIYSFISSDITQPIDLTYNADHILKDGIVQWAWQSSLEPRLYCVLSTGNLAVLSYNRQYGVYSWARWTFGTAKVKSVCVTDSTDGQIVWLIVERDGTNYLEKFNEPDVLDSLDYDYSDISNTDTPEKIQVVVESNEFETSSTLYSSQGRQKRVTKAYFKMLYSKGAYFSYNSHTASTVTPEGEVVQMAEENIAGGFEQNLQYTIKSIPGKALTILSVALKVEVV